MSKVSDEMRRAKYAVLTATDLSYSKSFGSARSLLLCEEVDFVALLISFLTP